MPVALGLDLGDTPVNSSVISKADIKRRSELETKLKEVRNKKKKKSDHADTNNMEFNKCDSEPGNVNLNLKAKGLSAIGDAEVSLKFGNSGKATLNLDANGISNVGKARLDLGVDDGDLYIPGLSNLFVGKSLSNCTNRSQKKDTESEKIGSEVINNRKSGSDTGNGTDSNVNNTDSSNLKADDNEKTSGNATSFDANSTVSSNGLDKANVTLVAPLTAVSNSNDVSNPTTVQA
ncbi:unnamed protein product [Diatraea saccharalis]|uniref:Uncharacterized protein n=1 Tax=Diatraea saccharalis TaxID=40085 RepID=A0A9N9W8Z4_9NEOP|nr:unnamed protein product [Diatraea saccharalis]